MSVLRIPILVVVYFSIATVLAEIGLLVAVSAKNGLNQEKVLQLLAVAHEVDLHSMWQRKEAMSRPIQKAQVSHDEVVHRRQEIGLDLDLRELATEKGMRDIYQLGIMLDVERERYIKLRDAYNAKRDNIQQGAADQRLLDMQQRLQAMQAKQAKDQIDQFLDVDADSYESSLQIAVTIIKAMPLEKRKKILAEFKTGEDANRLHEILRRIRLGVPDVELIRDTREKLQKFENRR